MSAMNTIGTRKERMRRALGRQPVDRLPVQTNFTRAMGRKLRETLGVDASQLSRRLDNHLLRVDVGHTTRLSDDGRVDVSDRTRRGGQSIFPFRPPEEV